MSEHGASQRRSCRVVGVSISTVRYQQRRGDDPLRHRIRELARTRSRFGYRRIHALLVREGHRVNHKRVHRLYREEGLKLSQKRRKRLRRPAAPLEPQVMANMRWSADFVSDQLADGRRFRVLNVVDDCTREALTCRVATSQPGGSVARCLDSIAHARGYPQTLRTDNGPEFTSEQLATWARKHRVTLSFIQPGRPTQNAYVESFNGRFRDECLNQHWFRTLWEARTEIELWRVDYNTRRPHSSLANMTPLEYAQSIKPNPQTPRSLYSGV